MKLLIPLGSGRFEILSRPKFVDRMFREHRGTAAVAVLSEIVSALQAEGYDATVPSR